MSKMGQDRLWKYLKSIHAGVGQDQIVTSLLSSAERRLLSVSLKYRIFSTKVAVHESLLPKEAPECETFAQFRNEFFCNADNLEKALHKELSETALSDSDDNYGHQVGREGPRVTVYSEITSKSFQSFNNVLESMASDDLIRFTYRHLIRRDCKVDPSELQLPGFGLEIDVKSYGSESLKVLDGKDGEFGLLSPPDAEVDFSHVGLQLVQAVLDSDDPLKDLTRLVESAPLYLNGLSKVKVSEDVVEKVTQLSNNLGLPESLLAINGAEVSSAHVNIQSLAYFLSDYQAIISRHLSPFPESSRNLLARQIMSSCLQPKPVRFNVRSSAAIGLNNLESDERYKMWPRSLQSLLRPPTGQFYPITRNLVAVTIVMDVDSTSARFLQSVAAMVGQMVPMRVLLLLHSTSDNARLLDALYAIHLRFGPMTFLEFFRQITVAREQNGGDVDIEAIYDQNPAAVPLNEIIALTKAHSLTLKAAAFAGKYGAGPQPLVFVNGRLIEFNESNWQMAVVKTYQEEIYSIQMAIVSKELAEEDDYLAALMDSEENFTSRHPNIFLEQHEIIPSPQVDRWIGSPTVAEGPVEYSIVLYVDLNREADITLLTGWLRQLTSHVSPLRLGIVTTCKSAPQSVRSVIDRLSTNKIQLAQAIAALEQEPGAEEDRQTCITGPSDAKSPMSETSTGPLVTINGVRFGPFTKKSLGSLNYDDWLRYYWDRFGERHQSILDKLQMDVPEGDRLTPTTCFEIDLKMVLSHHRGLFTGNVAMEIPLDKVCHLTFPDHGQENPSELLNIQALLNPFSALASRILATFEELSGLIGGSIILNVTPEYTHNPVVNLYRFRGFNGTASPLPAGTTFALMLSTPSTWDIEEAHNVFDLDNLAYTEELHVVNLRLRGLILESEVKSRAGGIGVPDIPIQLYSGSTLVAQGMTITTMGYSQLSASPGIYRLEIPRNDGFSLEVGPNSAVTLDSLAVNFKKVALTLAPGLDYSGLQRDRVPLLFGKDARKARRKQVHVFTIASGRTYERLVRIMMRSVVKHSSAPVKFWIVANFVSPSFEASLTVLADEFDFTFELIRFKWPAWLNGQSRKFRRVWAYKILFLDWLPYEIDRLIYVDADQVMRGDIAELARIDMKGRVYGFVPFCESRAETAHLHFWKSGYWAEYLQGRPYHISALFMVDMDQLRSQGVADRLRSHYQMLSHDPSSLSNLDQDLPNNLQHDIPIYPLPSEWLWCETWCSNPSKNLAKSIDLCNNPLKSENKLQQAQRIIPEWAHYDEEISQILQREASGDSTDEETVEGKDEL